MSIRFNSSLLFVEDVEVSRRFYEGLLGQNVELDHGECVIFSGGFSIMKRDYAHRVIFGRTFALYRENHDFELYFETDELDEVYRTLEEAHVPLVHGIVAQPWGQRDFRVYDPDRHMVEIGEPMSAVVKRFLEQGMTVEEVVAKTSMPGEMVQAIQAT